MTHRRPTTPLDHIAHAKDTITGGADPTYAIAHALIAIAQLMAAKPCEIITTSGPTA